MPGPTDAATVALVADGELLVIDGRGTPWKFVPGQTPPKPGQQKAKEPSGFKAAWVRADRLSVIDSGGVVWVYDFGTGTWTKGPKIEVAETDPPQTGPWQYGPVLVPVQEEEAA